MNSASGPAPYVVVDIGSGISKLGFAGNLQPTYAIPTVVATRQQDSIQAARSKGLEDFDAFIGEDALNNNSTSYSLGYPVRQSVVEDWDSLERFYQQCLFHYLRVEPEDHCVLLAQPLGASPESRQQLAEIMFETFGVSGAYLGLQAVLSLYAAVGVRRELATLDSQLPTSGQTTTRATTAGLWRQAAQGVLTNGLDPYSVTGVVVDIGEGSTSVIPVMDGFVARSSARSMGVGGRDLTQHVQQAIRSCGVGVPPEMSWDLARQIKETHCYVCVEPSREPARLAARSAAGRAPKTHTILDPRAGNKEIVVPLGPELFLASELLFTNPPAHPTAIPGTATTNRTMGGWQPLPELVDWVVQSCPIDARRALYGNVALTGGTACTRNIDRRIKTDLASIANNRLHPGSRAIDVSSVSGPWAPHAAWLGGSLLAGGGAPTSLLTAATTSRAYWQEHGRLIDAGLAE